MFDFASRWIAGIIPGAQLSRRSWLVLTYKPKGETASKDISENISKYFLSLSYTDNLSGTADDVTITLEDRGRLWGNAWFPVPESVIDITIKTYNWSNLADGEKDMGIGAFEIDEIEQSMPPSTVQIKAVAVIGDSSLRGIKKNRSWDKAETKQIAEDIAKGNGMTLFWDCDENPVQDHAEQSDESDLAFLQKMCKDSGLALKVSHEQIIIFDEYKYEMQKPVLVIERPGETYNENENAVIRVNRMTAYKFTDKTRETYKACHVKYQSGKDNAVIEATFTEPGQKASTGETLEVSEQVKDIAEAERLAKKKLREKNKEAVTGSITLPGNINIAAGIVVEVRGFGIVDGNFIVVKAQHEISASAFTTSVDVRRCLNGY